MISFSHNIIFQLSFVVTFDNYRGGGQNQLDCRWRILKICGERLVIIGGLSLKCQRRPYGPALDVHALATSTIIDSRVLQLPTAVASIFFFFFFFVEDVDWDRRCWSVCRCRRLYLNRKWN